MNLYDSRILRAAEYMENNLKVSLTLDDLAKQAAFSKFHFTRIFKAVTKEPINDYIRKRRMTLAAHELIETEIPIIQIALTYGYNSQAAFTRTFKNYFGLTPQTYRKKGSHHYNLYKEPLSELMLEVKKQPVRQEAMITELPVMHIGGILIRGDLENHQISKLWNQFYEELAKEGINPEAARCFGYESLDESNTPYYLAAVEVDHHVSLPAGWTAISIPSQKYSVFTIDNVIDNIGFAIEDIYKNQLSKMSVKPIGNYHFEFYDEDFKAHDSGFNLQIYVPIE